MGLIFPNDPISRVDGRLKVTGAAKYFAEYESPDMAYCVMATSTITRGSINNINTAQVKLAPGVIDVITFINMPEIPGWKPDPKNAGNKPLGNERYRLFSNNQVLFNGQPIAMVIADTLERAQYAASLVKANYTKENFKTDIEANKDKAQQAKGPRGNDYKRGDTSNWKQSAVNIEADYYIPNETHNPMELHGIIAKWEGAEKLTVWAKTQGVKSTQRTMMSAFKLEEKNVQVFGEFVGGGFGMALRTWPQEVTIAAAARKIGRPLKLVMSRDQMFTMVGYRPATLQTIRMGANADGKLNAIVHEATAQTSTYEDFMEGTVNASKFMYACPNVSTVYRLVPLDYSSPIWMRGPGEATGTFALESAMDEMAHKLKMDPLQFRLLNYAETDPERNLPFSTKYVKEGYKMGADKIGWDKRPSTPGTLKEGDWMVGYGMSSGVFNAGRGEASCRAVLNEDGILLIQTAASDAGPGTATMMVQVASEALGLPINKIKYELGNSNLPPAPSQGGSSTTSTVGSAVHIACMAVKNALIKLLVEKEPAFKDMKVGDLVFSGGNIASAKNAATSVDIAAFLAKHKVPAIDITETSKSDPAARKFSIYSFSIHFVEVRVHPKTGVVRVTKVVTVADAGKIVSPKSAASQMIGGVTGGIGMALMEETVTDHRFGRMVNNNFADYHVPVSADVPHIETIFIDTPDTTLNPIGSKGMGEIALIGFAAAIANAVFNATGKRVRDLPITPDKLI